MKKDKLRIILITIVSVLLLATVLLYGYMVVSKKEVDLGSSIAFLASFLVVIFMAFFVTRRYKDIKQGMPLEDERSKKIMHRAAAMTFYISIYLLLVIGWFGDDHFERPSQATGAGILGMAIIFFISWVYFSRQEKL